MTAVGDGRNLPGQQYPIVPTRHACHQPRHRQRSFRRRWGRRPVEGISIDARQMQRQPRATIGRLSAEGWVVHGGGKKGEGVGDGADLGESALGEDAAEMSC